MRREIDFYDEVHDLLDDPSPKFKDFVERTTGLDYEDEDLSEDDLERLAYSFIEDEADAYELDEAESRYERGLEDWERAHGYRY